MQDCKQEQENKEIERIGLVIGSLIWNLSLEDYIDIFDERDSEILWKRMRGDGHWWKLASKFDNGFKIGFYQQQEQRQLEQQQQQQQQQATTLSCFSLQKDGFILCPKLDRIRDISMYILESLYGDPFTVIDFMSLSLQQTCSILAILPFINQCNSDVGHFLTTYLQDSIKIHFKKITSIIDNAHQKQQQEQEEEQLQLQLQQQLQLVTPKTTTSIHAQKQYPPSEEPSSSPTATTSRPTTPRPSPMTRTPRIVTGQLLNEYHDSHERQPLLFIDTLDPLKTLDTLEGEIILIDSVPLLSSSISSPLSSLPSSTIWSWMS